MIALWIAAALICAAAGGLMLWRAQAARLAADSGLEDPALAVYRRQLSEVDDLAERGLIAEAELRSAHTEAARRLLSAADAPSGAWRAGAGGGPGVLAGAILAPVVAISVYLWIGSPGAPDQPYRARVAAWGHADPSSLSPEQLAAVIQTFVDKHPSDPVALAYLARAQAASGDTFTGERSLQKALALAPNRADLWTLDGQMIAADATNDQLPDDARAAFLKAHSLDPKAPVPRYFLGRGQIAAGDVDGGLAVWRALAADMPEGNPDRQALDQEIATAARTRAVPADGPADQAAPAGGDQQAFIRRMVQSLAARLAADPNDPAGWARLVRSYSVLGDIADRDAALAKARVLFKDRPQDLAAVEAAETTRP